MTLAEFNAAPREDALALLEVCLDVPRWQSAIASHRPYASAEALFSAARTAAHPFDPAEIERALRRHPRIGERVKSAGAEAAMSAAEQRGLGPAEPQLDRALALGNLDYERKFKRVFLIRAAGRSRREVLAELRRRMGHTEAEELATIASQLREIAVLRLQGIIHP